MERRDAMLILLLLGGGGYACYTNWDTISDRLGLEQLDPGRLKAVELAKEAFTFTRAMSNWQHLQSRQTNEEIEIGSDPWSTEHIAGPNYRVQVQWIETEDGTTMTHGFHVNIATRIAKSEDA
tara:strand:+ start:47 stop:415 length:369 start_codon:yes stop_codon:yes gene_type:complete